MKAIKNEAKHVTLIRIDTDIYQTLRKMSYEDNVSVNQIVNQAIKEYIKRGEFKNE